MDLTIEELYLELLMNGPDSQIEFWDPTLEAILLFEELEDIYVNSN